MPPHAWITCTFQYCISVNVPRDCYPSFPQAVLKQKLVGPILQMLFPLLSAVPPPGQEDPEYQEQAVDDDGDSESPKHFAAQVCVTINRW